MTKSIAVKGMAVRGLQPIAHDAPVAKTASNGVRDVAFMKASAPRSPPAKARGVRQAAKALPKPKKKAIDIYNAIADASDVAPKIVKNCLDALFNVAAETLRDEKVFKGQGAFVSTARFQRFRSSPPNPISVTGEGLARRQVPERGNFPHRGLVHSHRTAPLATNARSSGAGSQR